MFWRKSVKKSDAEVHGIKFSGALVVANWKCHKSPDEAKQWLDEFAALYTPNPKLTIVIAPTFICLDSLSTHLKNLAIEGVYLAAQDVSPFPRGGYTGEVSADMLKGMADYVIVGHSERRRYFKESNRLVANKVEEALDVGIIPIVCVDDDNGMAQLNALNEIDSKNVIVAYGPVDAMNFRIPEEPERVARMTQAIKNNKPDWSVIYGGAVGHDNCVQYLNVEELAGVFVGSASLDAKEFATLCNSLKS